MNAAISTHRQTALTRLELMMCLGSLGVVLFLFVAALIGRSVAREQAQRMNCLSNVKAIGLSFRMWANDFGESFPWQVSVETNGTMELVESSDIYRHFQAISKELSSPKVLACAADTTRSRVTVWEQLNNQHLSYFVGLDASETQPRSMLMGDRNIIGGELLTNRVRRFTNGSPAVWGPGIHPHQGNIGLGDGSALQVADVSLPKQFQSAMLAAKAESLRLSIP